MEAMVLSGEPVSPPRAMLVTGLNELPPEVWPASDPAHILCSINHIPHALKSYKQIHKTDQTSMALTNSGYVHISLCIITANYYKNEEGLSPFSSRFIGLFLYFSMTVTKEMTVCKKKSH
jgi:hypothetical protein